MESVFMDLQLRKVKHLREVQYAYSVFHTLHATYPGFHHMTHLSILAKPGLSCLCMRQLDGTKPQVLIGDSESLDILKRAVSN